MVELREREPGHGLRVQIEAYVLDPPTKTPLFEYTSRPTRDVISSGTAFIFDTVTSAPNKRSLSNDARQTVPATFSVCPASGSPPRSGKAGSHDSTTGRGFSRSDREGFAWRPTRRIRIRGTGDFDYTGGAVERPGLVDALEDRVDGNVRFDEYSKRLYATDASAYEVTPIGVVVPESTADVAAVHEYCYEEGIPVLPAGRHVARGPDRQRGGRPRSHRFDGRGAVDGSGGGDRPSAGGAYVGDLNAAVEPHGLKFAPDPAWRDKSAIGGAIGNNSTGSHLAEVRENRPLRRGAGGRVSRRDGDDLRRGRRRGATRVRRRRERRPPLPRIHAEIVRILDEEAGAIDERFPEMKRNVSGYNLDRLLAEYRGEYGEAGVVNLGRLMAGSEGTLATVTEATVSLVEIPETKAVALLTYDDLLDAMEDVAPILDHDPAAVEVMDDVLLGLAADTPEFEGVVGCCPRGPTPSSSSSFTPTATWMGNRRSRT